MALYILLVVLTASLPTAVSGQSGSRNVYDEASFLGARDFISYVKRVGLAELLQDPKETLTVFAPTPVAFSQLAPDIRDRLDKDDDFCKEVMTFHLVKGVQSVDTNNATFITLSGSVGRVDVYQAPSIKTVSGCPVLLEDNQCSNGVVHILSRVMYPLPTGTALDFVGGNDFSMMFLALSKAGITSLLNEADITVFVPTNSAFQSLPPGVFSGLLDDINKLTNFLRNHVVNEVLFFAYVADKGDFSVEAESGHQLKITLTDKNSRMMVDDAQVTSMDINVNNGVVHVIDKVLLPTEIRPAEHSFRVV